MAQAYLLLGSNLGNRYELLQQASEALASCCGSIAAVSPLYETEPWGFTHENDFLNAVVQLHTRLSPDQLLRQTQAIERAMGRFSKGRQYEARTLDIDILFYDQQIIRTRELIVPHPRLHMRRFTLQPLHDIAPNFFHPVLKQPIADLLANCHDSLPVKPLELAL